MLAPDGRGEQYQSPTPKKYFFLPVIIPLRRNSRTTEAAPVPHESTLQESIAPQQSPISSWPRERLEEALAAQMGISVEDLRELLAAGKTNLDTLVQAQAFLCSGETESADGKFDEVIAEVERTREESGKRLAEAFAGKAQIAFDKVDYKIALAYRQKAAALVDRSEDPLAWADAQIEVTFIQSQLAMYRDAEPLLREILRINEEKRGAVHSQTAKTLNNLAILLLATNRPSEAEPLMRRHVGIFFLFLTNSDHRHPHTLDAVENYLRLACELKLPYSEILARLDAEREKAGLSEEAFEEIWAEVLAGNSE